MIQLTPYLQDTIEKRGCNFPLFPILVSFLEDSSSSIGQELEFRYSLCQNLSCYLNNCLGSFSGLLACHKPTKNLAYTTKICASPWPSGAMSLPLILGIGQVRGSPIYWMHDVVEASHLVCHEPTSSHVN